MKLRREYEKAHADERRSLTRLQRVKPKTMRGAIALLNWLVADLEDGHRFEQGEVLKSVARTLPTIAAR